MRVFVIGAGLVGAKVVEALHADHDLTVVDLEPGKLKPLAQRYDVATVAASAVSGRELAAAGIAESDLVIACTSRDEANLVAGTFAHSAAPNAKTVVRTSSAEYVEIWREGRLDVDFVVSSELETARAVSAAIGMPSARHTDSFAEGQVQIAEVDVRDGASDKVVGRPLRAAAVPPGSRVAAIIRAGGAILPSGDAVMQSGDRVVVVGSPTAAQAWCELVSPRRGDVRDVIVYGAQQLGVAIARALLERGLAVRVIEPDVARAALVAELLPRARVFNTAGLDREFLEREGIARMQAAVFAMRDDSRNLYAATVAHRRGVPFTIALAHDPASGEVYEHAGIDVTIDPQLITAEEIARFAHDPRTRQVSMLEHDRFEILDVTARADGELVGLSLRAMPIRGALIAAIVRDDRAIFPRSDEVLRAGDRVIVFTEASRAAAVERAL
jgi:trk system potassium uptake protein TrkA